MWPNFTTRRALYNGFIKRIITFIGSGRCFYLIVAGLVLQALWIALSGRYPMAFDEDFHFGVIQLYAHHISPFWSSHPAGSNALGAVARDPSYLYHWLMSFPYRLSSNVIFLRLINIGLFAWGLVLYRKLLLKTGASRALVHFCLAVFVLLPIVPLLAAQINYDNLFLPLTALSIIWTLELAQKVTFNKLAGLATLVTLTCLVKYAFLPIVLVLVVYLVVRWRQTGVSIRQIRPPRRLASWLLVALLALSLGLFIQRYVVNLAHYHKPVPSCEEVLGIDQCTAYGPWNRDFINTQLKPADAPRSPLIFAGDWFYGMWFRTFFAVAGPATDFQTRGPFVLPALGAVIFAVAALAAVLVSGRRLLRVYDKHAVWLLVAVTAIYTVVLWLDEYHSFLRTGQPVAINGRYLLPVVPLLMIMLALGANSLLSSRRRLKVALAGLAIICFIWGGGALTFILRSYDSWLWPNRTVQAVNRTVQAAVGPMVPGYRHPLAFMGHHGT